MAQNVHLQKSYMYNVYYDICIWILCLYAGMYIVRLLMIELSKPSTQFNAVSATCTGKCSVIIKEIDLLIFQERKVYFRHWLYYNQRDLLIFGERKRYFRLWLYYNQRDLLILSSVDL